MKTLVQVEIFCHVFAYTKTETCENVLVWSGPDFRHSCWSVLARENSFGRPEESQGITGALLVNLSFLVFSLFLFFFFGSLVKNRLWQLVTTLFKSHAPCSSWAYKSELNFMYNQAFYSFIFLSLSFGYREGQVNQFTNFVSFRDFRKCCLYLAMCYSMFNLPLKIVSRAYLISIHPAS